MNKYKLLKKVLDGKQASVYGGLMNSGRSGFGMLIEVTEHRLTFYAPSIDRYNKDLSPARKYEANKHLRDITEEIRKGLGDRLKEGVGDTHIQKPINKGYMNLTVPAFTFRIKDIVDITLEYDSEDKISSVFITLVHHTPDGFVNKLKVQITYIKDYELINNKYA